MHARKEVSGARGVVPSERMLGYDNGYINANIDDTRANFSKHDCHSMVSRLLGIPLRAMPFFERFPLCSEILWASVSRCSHGAKLKEHEMSY